MNRELRDDMLSYAHIFFKGRVQGVFFRANTERKALEYRVNGWVKNLQDGRVEAVFEGEKDDVERLIDWCANMQPYAVVEDTKIEWKEPKGLKGFVILR